MITSKERNIIKYRPALSYVPEFLSIVNTEDMTYELSPTVDRLTKKTPSGVLGELLTAKEDTQVILERLKRCISGDDIGVPLSTYIDAISTDPELAYNIESQNASSSKGTTQFECIPLLLDAIQEYDRMICMLSKALSNRPDALDDLEKIEHDDHQYIDDMVNKDLNGMMTNDEKLALETRVIAIEAIGRIANNTKNFVKDINTVLYSDINTVYNNNIVDIVEAYGEAPINVLEAIQDMYTVEFKKSVMACNNDKVRMRRLDTSGMKAGVSSTFQKVSSLRDTRANEVYKWIGDIDTNYDQSPLTQIVSDGLDSIEFINKEYERTKTEYFKQIKLDSLVKSDLISTMQAKKTARQKLNLISDIITERKSNSFDAAYFVTSRSLTSTGTLCTR